MKTPSWPLLDEFAAWLKLQQTIPPNRRYMILHLIRKLVSGGTLLEAARATFLGLSEKDQNGIRWAWRRYFVPFIHEKQRLPPEAIKELDELVAAPEPDPSEKLPATDPSGPPQWVATPLAMIQFWSLFVEKKGALLPAFSLYHEHPVLDARTRILKVQLTRVLAKMTWEMIPDPNISHITFSHQAARTLPDERRQPLKFTTKKVAIGAAWPWYEAHAEVVLPFLAAWTNFVYTRDPAILEGAEAAFAELGSVSLPDPADLTRFADLVGRIRQTLPSRPEERFRGRPLVAHPRVNSRSLSKEMIGTYFTIGEGSPVFQTMFQHSRSLMEALR